MPVRNRMRAYFQRLKRIEHREMREFRAWIETTRNLVHLTSLFIIPLLIAAVTAVSRANAGLSFLLFPPLASGTYTLFSNPKGKYSTAWKFVGGLTIGALCGWFTLIEPAAVFFSAGRPIAGVSPGGAALSIFLTGAITWMLDVEIPSAFSTALLVLLTGTRGQADIYVLSIAVSSTLVAIVFVLWRRQVYSERAEYLYQSTNGDDHVLVPMRGSSTATAMLGARLASAHDAGKVVLLDMVDENEIEVTGQPTNEETVGDETTESIGAHEYENEHEHQQQSETDEAADSVDEQTTQERAASAFASALEGRADVIRTKVGVPCEVVVASEGTRPARTVMQTAHETNCDLIAVPYETHHGSLSPFLRELFSGDTDVLVHRTADGRTDWKHVLVSVRQASDVAHSMLDFATRLVGETGHISVSHCITNERQRRTAEEMLANLTETASAACETRVSRSSMETFFETYAQGYDLIIIGASQDRSAASRFLSPPTFDRIDTLDCDVAILDRNYHG